MKKKLILVTNDDGINAKGIAALVEAVRSFGDVVVIAPDQAQSGQSHAITVKHPLRVYKLHKEERLSMYSCNGTPADCVKIGLHEVLKQRPDFIVSGINHGANTSTSILYSGTMAAAIEGYLNNIPSVGFSLNDFSSKADFSTSIIYVKQIFEKLINSEIPSPCCINVNIPAIPAEEIKGVKICRQSKGAWQEKFDKRIDPAEGEYYWLTGAFTNLEPSAKDTDEWAINNKYISIVPVKTDLTDYKAMDELSTIL